MPRVGPPHCPHSACHPPAGVYALTAPASVQPLYAAGMAILYALLLAVTRTWLLERRYRVRGCWAGKAALQTTCSNKLLPCALLHALRCALLGKLA